MLVKQTHPKYDKACLHEDINTNVPDTVIIKKKFILAPLVSPIVVIKSPSINNVVSLFTHATFCQSEYEVMQKKKAEEF